MSVVQTKPVAKYVPGIGLVEVIAAVGVAVIVITSLVSLAIFTLRSSLQSTLYLEGSKIATKQLELVRALRDQSTSWGGFISSVALCSSSPCYMNDNVTVSSGTGTSGNGLSAVSFSFSATNSTGGTPIVTDNTVRVRANATWIVGTRTVNTNVYTDLTNWRGL